MLTSEVRPTTIPSLKRLADQLHRERGGTHTAALDTAARQAGYSCYAHARAVIAKVTSPGLPAPEFSAHRELVVACNQADFLRGAQLHREGASLPGFDGGNEHVLAGWFAQKANVNLPGAGSPPGVYAALMSAMTELTLDHGWAETLTHVAMLDLSAQSQGRLAKQLRQFGDRQFTAYADSVDY